MQIDFLLKRVFVEEEIHIIRGAARGYKPIYNYIQEAETKDPVPADAVMSCGAKRE